MDYDEMVSMIVDAYSEKFEKDYTRIANEVNDIYYNDVDKMYDSFIQQYYTYHTKSYIRHWEGVPGTGKGTNLLYGKQFKKHKGKDPYFEIRYDGSDMAGDYQHDNADDVISQVASGIRGVSPYWTMPWSGKYNSRYFHYSGTLDGAIETYLDTFEDRMTPVFMRRWRKAGWL